MHSNIIYVIIINVNSLTIPFLTYAVCLQIAFYFAKFQSGNISSFKTRGIMGGMRILGIDPGIGITGYSIIEADENGYELLNSGSIQTNKSDTVSKRLVELYEDMLQICNIYKPDEAAIEQLFFFKNQKTIIPVAEARGVILAALEKSGIKTAEYTPLTVKQVLTGHGRADKSEVRTMVEKFITLNKNTKLDDTVDSIAIAICHARSTIF